MQKETLPTFSAPPPSLLGAPTVCCFAELFKIPRIEIPIYQRKYCWTEDQWSGIWECLEDQVQHRVGRLMFYPEKDKKICVDGQQRIITTLLILCAFRDNPKATPHQVDTINNILFTTAPSPWPESIENIQTSRLIPSESDRPAFYSILIHKTPDESEASMVQAKKFFDEKVSKTQKPFDLLLYRLLNNVKVLDFTLNKDSNTGEGSFEALSVFNVKNSQLLYNRWPGINLANVDLIRNFFVAKQRFGEWKELEQLFPQPQQTQKLEKFFAELLKVSDVEMKQPQFLYQAFVIQYNKEPNLIDNVLSKAKDKTP